MNRKWLSLFVGTLSLGLAGPALASDAATSAGAGATRGRDGAASATAQYAGDVGFARSDSRSGRISLARGLAVGLDEDGLSLSVSNAVAPALGPAVATTFNLSIDRDGGVSSSSGLSLARGPVSRTASAGGSTSSHGATIAQAGGTTDGRGRVDATTRSADFPPPGRMRTDGLPEPRRATAEAPLVRERGNLYGLQLRGSGPRNSDGANEHVAPRPAPVEHHGDIRAAGGLHLSARPRWLMGRDR